MRRHLYFSLIGLLLFSASALALTRARLDSLVSEMKSDDPNRVSKAAIMLAEYGPEATEAIPALLEMIRNKEVIFYTPAVLSYISAEEPIEKILMLTKDNDSFVQSSAMECLKQRDLDRGRVLEIYTELLDHENPFTRLRAVNALCQVGSGELCLDAVIQLAHHEDPLVNAMAISAIGDIGIANQQIKQGLLDSFSNPDKREVAKTALIYQQLYPDEKKGLEQLRILLKDDDRNVRWHAVEAIGNLKDIDAQTIQLSKELMQDEDQLVVIHTCYAMIRHHIETEKAWEILLNSLKIDDAEDSFEAISTLMVLIKLGPAAKTCQEQLIETVDAEDELVQLLAVWALGEIQPSKERVLPVLENKLKTTNNFLVWNMTKKTIKKLVIL